ncbi:two-component system, chemotaxis family, response regulator CheY [Methylobacterium phyllostachyos]|uniref:Two-component system, chemotaxis family, response regulator CheY n=1 Tax=Methylobacterium phyllostachyos TaxID=582672 RepID=A0A1G9YC44_9HYPH|nr:response regulator [Methylobacterium phyllostachyos]SDN06649.1 two-component system, chemotaxis family, response regulator CheY [Methylobacterium phyllostachyos]
MTRILVVDDATTVRMYYRDVLEEAGFAVEEAVNGFEGLEKAVAESFDLILVDVNMPKMDGYAFLRQGRTMPELQAVPAVMISTESAAQDRDRAYAAGANLYLVKPVRPEVLTEVAAVMAGVAP